MIEPIKKILLINFMLSVLFEDLLLRDGEVRLYDVLTQHVKSNMM